MVRSAPSATSSVASTRGPAMATRDLQSSAAGSAAPPVIASPTQATRSAPALPGNPFPLGATVRDGGTNFAVASSAADGILLCLFDAGGTETQIPLLDYDAGVWHGFLPG